MGGRSRSAAKRDTNNATGSSRVPFMNLFIAWAVAERLGTEGNRGRRCGLLSRVVENKRDARATRHAGIRWTLSRGHRRRGDVQIGSRARKISRSPFTYVRFIGANSSRRGGDGDGRTRLLIRRARRESLNSVLSSHVCPLSGYAWIRDSPRVRSFNSLARIGPFRSRL